MTTGSRYRVKDGRACIDINVAHSRQLFDSRDPAPFRERDLDDDAVEYLLAAAEEIPRGQPLAIEVAISAETEPSIPPESIAVAVRTHFRYELEQTQRRFRNHIRRGQISLALGLTILFTFLGLAELALALRPGTLREILREGLVITGWVAMWRPLELLLFDWWPVLDTRRQIRRILDAPVSVRYSERVPPGSTT